MADPALVAICPACGRGLYRNDNRYPIDRRRPERTGGAIDLTWRHTVDGTLACVAPEEETP